MKKLLLLLLLCSAPAFAQSVPGGVTGQITATAASCVVNVANTACVTQPLNYNTATVGVSTTGTWSATLVAEGSTDGGTTWTALGAAYTANQQTVYSVPGYTHIRVRATAYASGTAFVLFNPSAVNLALPIDLCASKEIAKQSAFANIATATTTALVTGVTNKTVTVCGYAITMTGTTSADTILFETGTGGTCGASTSSRTATYSSGILTQGATVVSAGNAGQALFAGIVSGDICAVTTVATGPSINVSITFVQQ